MSVWQAGLLLMDLRRSSSAVDGWSGLLRDEEHSPASVRRARYCERVMMRMMMKVSLSALLQSCLMMMMVRCGQLHLRDSGDCETHTRVSVHTENIWEIIHLLCRSWTVKGNILIYLFNIKHLTFNQFMQDVCAPCSSSPHTGSEISLSLHWDSDSKLLLLYWVFSETVFLSSL